MYVYKEKFLYEIFYVVRFGGFSLLNGVGGF